MESFCLRHYVNTGLPETAAAYARASVPQSMQPFAARLLLLQHMHDTHTLANNKKTNKQTNKRMF